MFKYKPARSFKHLIFCFFVKKTVPCTMYKLVSTIFGAVFCHQERSVVTYSVPGLHFALPTYSIREYVVIPWKILKLMWKLVLIVWTCRWGPLGPLLCWKAVVPFPFQIGERSNYLHLLLWERVKLDHSGPKIWDLVKKNITFC